MFFRCGLLGERISGSLSPRIFEWGFRICGLEGEYRLHDLPPHRAQQLVRDSDWQGLNVTTPHKTAALAWCEGLTERAKEAGAVNVLFRRDGAIWGDNTDIAGCKFALRRRWGDRQVLRALVIGSGGAGRAAAVALKRVFAPAEIVIASRDPQAARARLSGYASDLRQTCCIGLRDAAAELDTFDAVIQATPVGGTQRDGVPLPEPFHFRRKAVVMDLIYAPLTTPFLRAAARDGAETENGLVMLIAQAAACFEIWTGREFPLDRALTELLSKMAAE